MYFLISIKDILTLITDALGLKLPIYLFLKGLEYITWRRLRFYLDNNIRIFNVKIWSICEGIVFIVIYLLRDNILLFLRECWRDNYLLGFCFKLNRRISVFFRCFDWNIGLFDRLLDALLSECENRSYFFIVLMILTKIDFFPSASPTTPPKIIIYSRLLLGGFMLNCLFILINPRIFRLKIILNYPLLWILRLI